MTAATSDRPRTRGLASAPLILSVRDASLSFGSRTLWSHLNLRVRPGEFVAVLGPNGAGKTSLLRAILGAQPLTAGSIELLGAPVRRGHRLVGYVPQQRLADRGTPLRARDFVGLGLDGHRFGLPLPSRARRQAIDQMMATIDATCFATRRIGDLSGGEQQRLRIGQALIGNPKLLLCDEPLISLDLHQQRAVKGLYRRQPANRRSSRRHDHPRHQSRPGLWSIPSSIWPPARPLPAPSSRCSPVRRCLSCTKPRSTRSAPAGGSSSSACPTPHLRAMRPRRKTPHKGCDDRPVV